MTREVAREAHRTQRVARSSVPALVGIQVESPSAVGSVQKTQCGYRRVVAGAARGDQSLGAERLQGLVQG